MPAHLPSCSYLSLSLRRRRKGKEEEEREGGRHHLQAAFNFLPLHGGGGGRERQGKAKALKIGLQRLSHSSIPVHKGQSVRLFCLVPKGAQYAYCFSLAFVLYAPDSCIPSSTTFANVPPSEATTAAGGAIVVAWLHPPTFAAWQLEKREGGCQKIPVFFACLVLGVSHSHLLRVYTSCGLYEPEAEEK